jgi:shikimate dehydrogenase
MKISGTTRLAGIMGWPVTHSRSPVLHGFWLDENEIDGAYLPLPVRPEHIEQALRALPILGFRGCNLTIPHKQTALSVVDSVEPLARRIGAVNTVIIGPDGSLEGRNTDAFGFCENLREAVPEWNPAAGPAVILGAGGAARAIVAALADTGVAEIRIVNRTLANAAALASDLSTPKVPALILDLSSLPPSTPVVDIVYVPLETELLAAARRRGHPVVDGLGMLLHQGRPGFEAWFGVPVQVTHELRAAMRATLAPTR